MDYEAGTDRRRTSASVKTGGSWGRVLQCGIYSYSKCGEFIQLRSCRPDLHKYRTPTTVPISHPHGPWRDHVCMVQLQVRTLRLPHGLSGGVGKATVTEKMSCHPQPPPSFWTVRGLCGSGGRSRMIVDVVPVRGETGGRPIPNRYVINIPRHARQYVMATHTPSRKMESGAPRQLISGGPSGRLSRPPASGRPFRCRTSKKTGC